MNEEILWLAVTPTPYNNFLFDSIWKQRPGSLRVLFSSRGIPDGTWDPPKPLPSWWGGYYGGGRPNFNIVRKVMRSQATFTVVAGWNDWTRRIALVALFLFRKPYIIWTDTPHCTATTKHKVRNFVVRQLAGRAVAVMGTGRTGVDALRAMGVPSDKIVNFPYWVPLPTKVSYGTKSPETVRFCCIGRLVRQKNFSCAIQALALIREGSARLDIIGSGPELETLEGIAKQKGVEKQVRFVGFLDNMGVARYLRDESDCLILPSAGPDPFGVVIAEAMAFGLPVIGSQLCGAAVDRINDSENGFLLPTPVTAELLAERMREFVRDPGKISTMGRAARRTAEEWPVERGIQTLLNLTPLRQRVKVGSGRVASQADRPASVVPRRTGEIDAR